MLQRAAAGRRRLWVVLGSWLLLSVAAGNGPRADEPVVLAGPAMGTTYRVTLAASLPGRSTGELHREIEATLDRIDRAASTWRTDSDVSRFNRALAGEWVDVGTDLAAIVELAAEIHSRTDGRFDITVAPLIDLWQEASRMHAPPSDSDLEAARAAVGMRHVELQRLGDGAARLRKARAGVRLDLGGIGPGYAVDCIGERLFELGSQGHLVTLGGEARAWGAQADGCPWQLVVFHATAGSATEPLELAPGEAVAFSTPRPGASPIDPRTGRPVPNAGGPVMVRSTSCGRADALAVAAAVEGSQAR